MIKQNKFIVKPVVQFAVAFAAMTFSPLGGGNLRAEVLNLQQSTAIKGSVVDENNEPIIGATILALGGKNTQGTVTDFDGNFSINVKPGQKIKITYIGYDEAIVVAKQGMRVQLKVSAGVELQGVEVVAYGVQKKVPVTVAISSV